MKSSDILKEIKRIAKEVLPKGGQLILYGSRARNEATEDSDWDLLILLDKPEIEQHDYRYVLYPFTALSWCALSFYRIKLGCRRDNKPYNLYEG